MNWIAPLVDYGIVGLLIALSIVALAFSAERFLYYKSCNVAAFASKSELEKALGKNLFIIGTIAGNTPYVGLLGTVLGIMVTFHHISTTSTMDAQSIMAGLALALKATAIGLVVAIVAVALYNTLTKKARDLLLEWDIHHER